MYKLANDCWDEAEIKAITETIVSGQLSMGKKVNEFEQEFAKCIGTKYAVMVNSGSSANLLMIAALFFRSKNKLFPNDEIIVPAVSWSTTYAPLQQYGLKLKFVDIDRETLNFDLHALKNAISEKTRAIFAVNLLGNINDFTAIKEIMANKDIILLEDNCESLGATLETKQAGSYGEMASFSFYFSHHISTMEGGMITTDNEELYHLLLSLRSHGWTRHLPKENQVCGIKSDNNFIESFRFVLPGYNLRPLEISGAIGIKQLEKLPAIISQRRNNAQRFQEIINKYPFLKTQKEIGQSSWFGFGITLSEEAKITREQLLDIFTLHAIETRPIVTGNFANSESLKWFKYEIHQTLDNANYIDKNGFFIGNHHYDMKAEFAILENALTDIKLKNYW